jgi:hypothetical protein
LNSDAPSAQWARTQYVWKIVPCVNPDGVILGNYRTNYPGYDLNRHWNKPSHELIPELQVLKELVDRSKPIFCLDLHAHTKKFGVFLYGCLPMSLHAEEKPYPIQQSDSETTLGEESLTEIVQDHAKVHLSHIRRFTQLCIHVPYFAPNSCHFKTVPSKYGCDILI